MCTYMYMCVQFYIAVSYISTTIAYTYMYTQRTCTYTSSCLCLLYSSLDVPAGRQALRRFHLDYRVCVVITVQEEENSRLAAAKRRLQRELDELTEQNETLQRDLATARKGYVY